ncbi:MAG: histidine ammonia-lyase [Bacteroidia bacterium]|nr:histidine ammonia-lyase [Bacteroidia bacterium]
MEKNAFHYGEDHLTVELGLSLLNGRIRGQLSEPVRTSIQNCSKIVHDIAEGEDAVYGINTGFGPLCTVAVSSEETRALQEKLLKSHAVGVGTPISPDISRLMLILKVHALAKGHSGIRMETMKRILWMIDEEISPWVPSQGSVGASGDLAPLAHLFLPLIGLGKLWWKGELYKSSDLLQKFKLEKIELGPKEGLALINGTQFIAAHAVMVHEKFRSCLEHADLIGAMMLEGLQGSGKPFSPELHELRPYKGSLHVAQRISFYLQGSEILDSHADCDRVQDPYSLRCMPQVHGASRNAYIHLNEMLEVEMNSVTDNPLIFEDGHSISGGNFHGQPLALPLDYACLAAAELGNISDRRSYLSLTGVYPPVPKLLMKNTGSNSGFMIHQYTSAALVSENKSLCFPASADSVPTSLGQEDHVSMGSISGRKTLQVLENVEKILAIELLLAAQAVDYQRPRKSSPVLEEVHSFVRGKIDHSEEDKVYTGDIEAAIQLIKDQSLIKISHEYIHRSETDDLFRIH